MTDQPGDINVGPYRGRIAQGFADAGLVEALGNLPSLPEFRNREETVFFRRNRIVRFKAPFQDAQIDLHAKSFGPQYLLKDIIDYTSGSRARRSLIMASFMRGKGVGTPPPVAFLERWEGRRLLESHFITVYQDDTVSLWDELLRLYASDPVCRKVMALLDTVALAVRGMHDAGVFHGDLGNQNILMRRLGDSEWGDVQFVDLNRGRILGEVPLKLRAFDISRIALQSDFRRVFKEMYFRDVPPVEFQEYERAYRRSFSWHTRTRYLRHPLRAILGKLPARKSDEPFLGDQDIWIWDDRSAQAVSPMTSRDRRKHDSTASHARIGAVAASWLVPSLIRYGRLKEQCWKNPVELAGRIGVAVEPAKDRFDRELELLDGLGEKVPALIRFYHHETPAEWEFSARAFDVLGKHGHSAAVALVQDRRAVLDARKWREFVEFVLDRVAGRAEFIEIGHAVNRSKWGIWNLDEYRRLIDVVAGMRDKYPGAKFTGPAVIDFEYPYVAAALQARPAGLEYHALSHHLYVDRRGAPENKQGGFSAVEKFALARAIAQTATGCGDRLIVSEVNWPIKGTGVYSPVGAPYESPGPRFNDPSVSEDVYADYMIRYIALALCSGMVDRVFWWRLVARGFGLVDDTDPSAWRPRPAYNALRQFLALMKGAAFVERLPAPEGAMLLAFDTPGSGRVVLGYSFASPIMYKPGFAYGSVVDREGRALSLSGGGVTLGGSPVYFLP